MIEQKAKKIMQNNLVRLAIAENTDCTDVQMMIQFVEAELRFYSMYKFVIGKEISLKELYPVLVDLLNIRQMIPVFISNLIVDLSENSNVNPNDIKLIISTNKADASVVFIHAYNNTKPLKQLTWSEVFGQEAMMKMMAKQG
jgi:hypothetical protein|tara:strand:+ start:709 stop:1134 length:426 start_codon:yes stop_codon:yes gene_type:complete